MKPFKVVTYRLWLLFAGLSIASQLACTGSPKKVTTSTIPPISLSSTPTSLYVNDTLTITASLLNASDNANVTWTCTPVNTCGTFSSTQTASGTPITYTAPSTAGSVVITATSVASNTITASTPSITINPASNIVVSFNPAAPASISANETTSLTASVANDSANAGFTWSCTPVNNCGSFSANTSASGTAVTYTAPPSAGYVTVRATSVTDDAQSTSSTIGVTSVVATTLSAGNYVFSLSGTDKSGSLYTTAGVFTVAGSGDISGGEQDFSDYSYVVSQEPITGGTISASSDGNLLITLNFSDGYINTGSGSVTLDASLISGSTALLTEYDDWATSSGHLELQSATLSPPTAGYAFYVNGWNIDGKPLSIGGVIKVDGTGTVSGTGSILDENDDGTLTSAISLSSGSVNGPDALGFVTFELNSDTFRGSKDSGIVLNGYMVDSNHIRLIENWYSDNLGGITGGTALNQGSASGGFSSSSISGGTYIVSVDGTDTLSGPLQLAGTLTFNSDSSVTGNLSFNDITAQSPPGGTALSAESTVTPCSSQMSMTACYVINGTGKGNDGGTGRVTITNLTDGASFIYNLELYLAGNGQALAISMDDNNTYNKGSKDILAGLALQQASTSLTAASFNGSYAFNSTDFTGAGHESDALGAFVSNGSQNVVGFSDVNASLSGGTLRSDIPLAYTFAATSTNGVFIFTGPGTSTKTYTAYVVDRTEGVLVENDNSQLMLGSFNLQQ